MNFLNGYESSGSEVENDSENKVEDDKKEEKDVNNFFCADIDESSESEDDKNDDDSKTEPISKGLLKTVSKTQSTSSTLPSATAALTSKPTCSVYDNKYKMMQKETNAVLEQHVEMVETKQRQPRDQKICRMFKKGHCKYGKSCKMYHDKELQVVKRTIRSQPGEFDYDFAWGNGSTATDEHEDNNADNFKPKKRRFGLNDNLVPSNKVLRHFKDVGGHR